MAYLNADVAAYVLENVLHIKVDPSIPVSYSLSLHSHELEIANVQRVVSGVINEWFDICEEERKAASISTLRFSQPAIWPHAAPSLRLLHDISQRWQAIHPIKSIIERNVEWDFAAEKELDSNSLLKQINLHPLGNHFDHWSARGVLNTVRDLWQVISAASQISDNVLPAEAFRTIADYYVQIEAAVYANKWVNYDNYGYNDYGSFV